eukprot:TRINITY_DN92390_c0_g1_i1.p1 TRINITY_DN92390_c0_g1~~TRINITY_DN92390_c0_g1_i1.p1  ORF type:complete len:452 (+),score=79.23 TRINITY_DN92390_c0_g1_i1:55-1410(+)
MKLGSLALLHPCCLLLLEVPAFKQGAGKGLAQPQQEEALSCDQHNCAEGYVPKEDHHAITPGSLSDEACCRPTCALWKCSNGFVPKNESYFGNTAQSDIQCCDKACGHGDIRCPSGQVVVDKLKPGLNATVCCVDTCARTECNPPKVTPRPGSPKLREVSTDPNVCCDVKCAGVPCPANHTHIPEKLNDIATDGNADECCAPTCATFDCGNGYERTENASLQLAGDGSKCCLQKCGDMSGMYGYQCSEGYKAHGDSRSCPTQPCTDDMCCVKRCVRWTCSDHWVKNRQNDILWPASDTVCCSRTCWFMDCPADLGYVPGSNFNRSDRIGGREECCDKMCKVHTCGTGRALKPSAMELWEGPGQRIEQICCEPEICIEMRNMTSLGSQGCNAPPAGSAWTADSCNMSYTTLLNSASNKTENIRCAWSEDFKLCKVSMDQVLPDDCDGVVSVA